jgi:hypothetical protein
MDDRLYNGLLKSNFCQSSNDYQILYTILKRKQTEHFVVFKPFNDGIY